MQKTFSKHVFVNYCLRAYMSGENCRSTQKMNGKTVLITGANSGMGFEVAKEMAFRGNYKTLYTQCIMKCIICQKCASESAEFYTSR
jgi:hypothetical protein